MLNANTGDNKNLVIIIVRDSSGCSHVRLRWNALYYGGFKDIGFKPVITGIPCFDPGWLKRCKAVIYQRPINDVDLEILEKYRAYQPKFGYKIVFECDDQVFPIQGEGIPTYNMASHNFNKDLNHLRSNVAKALSMVDEVVVSTDFLKQAFETEFKFHNIRVIKNVVPRFLWSYPRKENKTEDLVKPTILYTGSSCHYRNPVEPRPPSPSEPNGFQGITAQFGDFENVWPEWIKKMVMEDKINLIVMGNIPFFWSDITNKIKYVPWKDCSSYPRAVMEQNADFQIAPLVENNFNKCKSSLRFTESCATGSLLLGTVFKSNFDSPYEEIHDDCKMIDGISLEELDKRFWKLCKKEKYNEILNWQYDFINKNGYWMESTKHADEWISMIDGNPNEKFI